MKGLPVTPQLLKVARRVVWFKEPADALSDPVHFLAHVMTYGTVEDLRAIREVVSREELLEALEQAPAGVFDARSWAYWNLMLGRMPAPPLPVRRGVQGVATTSNCVTPGAVRTNILRNVSSSTAHQTKSPAQGAATQCYVATNPLLAKTSGEYFKDCNPAPQGDRIGFLALRKELDRAIELNHPSRRLEFASQ